MEHANTDLFAFEFALEEHLSNLNSRIDNRLFDSLKKDALSSSNGLHIYKPIQNPFAQKEASPLDEIFKLGDSLPSSEPKITPMQKNKKIAIKEAEFMGSFGAESKPVPIGYGGLNEENASPFYFFRDESLMVRFKSFAKAIKKAKIEITLDNSNSKKSITDFLRKIKVYPLLVDASKYQAMHFDGLTKEKMIDLLTRTGNQNENQLLVQFCYLIFLAILTCVNLTFETSEIVAAHLKLNILVSKMHAAYSAFNLREKIFDDIKITPTEKRLVQLNPVSKIFAISQSQSKLPENPPLDLMSENFKSSQGKDDESIVSQIGEVPRSIIKAAPKTLKIIFEDVCFMNAVTCDQRTFEISAHCYTTQIKKAIGQLAEKPIGTKKAELQKLSVQNYHKFHKEISKQTNFDVEEYLNQNPYVFRFCELKNQLKRDLVSQLDSFHTSALVANNDCQFSSTLTKFFTKHKKNDLVDFGQLNTQLKSSKLASLICMVELKLLFKISMDMTYTRLNKDKNNDRIALDLEGFKLFGSLLELRMRKSVDAEPDYFLTEKFFRLS